MDVIMVEARFWNTSAQTLKSRYASSIPTQPDNIAPRRLNLVSALKFISAFNNVRCTPTIEPITNPKEVTRKMDDSSVIP